MDEDQHYQHNEPPPIIHPQQHFEDEIDPLISLFFHAATGFGFGTDSVSEDDNVHVQPTWDPSFLSVLRQEEEIPGDNPNEVVTRDSTWFPFKSKEVRATHFWLVNQS